MWRSLTGCGIVHRYGQTLSGEGHFHQPLQLPNALTRPLAQGRRNLEILNPPCQLRWGLARADERLAVRQRSLQDDEITRSMRKNQKKEFFDVGSCKIEWVNLYSLLLRYVVVGDSLVVAGPAHWRLIRKSKSWSRNSGFGKAINRMQLVPPARSIMST